jgi:signal transduction histidine kinase/HAMP domain-containing protein
MPKLFATLRFRVVLVVLLTTLPALGMLLHSDLEQRRLAGIDAQDESLRLVRLASAEQERSIAAGHHLLLAVAEIAAVRRWGTAPAVPQAMAECQAFLTRMRENFPEYDGFAVVAPNGDVLRSAPPATGPLSVADRAWYRQLVQTGQFVASEYLVDRLSGKGALVLAYPVRDPDSTLKGIVSASLDLGWLTRMIAPAQLPVDSTLLVIDRAGVILLRHPDPESLVGRSLREEPLVQRMLATDEGTLEETDPDGIQRIYGFKSLGTSSRAEPVAHLAIGLSLRPYQAEADRTLVWNTALLALVAALAMGVGLQLGNVFVTRPTTALLGAVKRIATGDLSADAGVPDDQGELGQIATAINGMVAALREHETQRNLAEEHIRSQNALMAGINRVFREAVTCESEEQVARACLAVAQELSGSRYGFIGTVNAADRLDIVALSEPPWEACRSRGPQGTQQVHDMPIRGYWARVIADGCSLIDNDPASHPDHTDTPWGHLPLTAFLGVPLTQAGRTIGLIGLANKEIGYDRADRQAVESLAGAFVEALLRKRAELALKDHATRLERSNRELQDFAYIASHDLQEPLRKIQSFGSRLEQDYAQSLSAQGLDYLGRMLDAGRRGQQMVSDLLYYSRVTTKAQPFTPLALGDLVHQAISNLQVSVEETGGQVIAGSMPTIEGDPTQIVQLFQNLIGNALKFHLPNMPPVVMVEAQPCDDRPEHVQITVRDNGIGFDEKYFDRIFQPFERLHGRGEYPGSGMGLAICRKIVERHGGVITVRSVPGQGTTFIVTLPAVQGADTSGQNPGEP